MLSISELENYLNNLLQISAFSDYAPNGLQVAGIPHIRKIALGVSASLDVLAPAVQWGADVVIVHHGLFWEGGKVKVLVGAMYQRVKCLMDKNVNLLAYHLPLDAHAKFGNAAYIAQKLQLKKIKPLGNFKGMPLGVQGIFSRKISAESLSIKIKKICGDAGPHVRYVSPMAQSQTVANISSIGIITGGAQHHWTCAKDQGLDAFMTGEISEYDWHDARENGVHFFAAGHHATERGGVQLLASQLKKKFGAKIETKFFDSDNQA